MIPKDQAKQEGLKICEASKSQIQNQSPFFTFLQKHFPDTITEDNQIDDKILAKTLGLSTLDYSALTRLLGLDYKFMQGLELTFTGKTFSNALYSSPCEKLLKRESSFNPYTESIQDSANEPQNTIIVGDNLDVLKLLKSAYYEKIKCIYIDPPYNTQNENFIYPDDFRENYKEILKEVGLLTLEKDEKGEEIEVESDELKFFKNISATKSHSGWLAFMLPRLKLARDLLKDDGVIFISIDDNEQARLRLLCDEIFGEENFVATMPHIVKPEGRMYGNIAKTHEFIFIYAKNIDILEFNEIQKQGHKFVYKDELGGFDVKNLENGNFTAFNANNRPNLRFSLFADPASPNSDFLNIYTTRQDGFIEITPSIQNGIEYVWRWGKEKCANELHNLCARKSPNGKYLVFQKIRKSTTKQKSIIWDKDMITQKGTQEISDIFNGNGYFTNPKPIKLIKRILEISTSAGGGGNNTDSKPDIILDFFAGSGTTAHACMELNAEDNGNRKWILVQLDEAINENKSKVAYDFCKNNLNSKNPAISDITVERVKRAGIKIAKDSTKQDSNNLSFSVYSLDSKPKIVSNDGEFKLEYGNDLTPLDKARNLALFAGKGLDKPLVELDRDSLYECEEILCVVNINAKTQDIISEEKHKNQEIFIDGCGDMSLENLLNLNIGNEERITIVY